MNNLIIESDEINGARKLLLKLEQEFAMSIVPCQQYPCKSRFGVCEEHEHLEWFEIPTKYRKLAGEGMMRWLLESKDNMRQYLYGNLEFFAHYERDKKGKVVRINITAK